MIWYIIGLTVFVLIRDFNHFEAIEKLKKVTDNHADVLKKHIQRKSNEK